MAKKSAKSSKKSSKKFKAPGASRTPPRRARAQRPSGAPWPWIIGLGVIALIGLAVALPFVRDVGKPGERYRSQGNVHISETAPLPKYNSDPPTSGPHYPYTAGWGSYDEVLPDPLLVHNLEDGGVIMWYRLGTPEENAANIAALEAVARGYRRVIIAPRENLDAPYVLTAWTRLQRFETIDEAGMRAFLEAYEGLDHHVPGAG